MRVKIAKKAGWGGGRMSGGLSYDPDPYLQIGEAPRISLWSITLPGEVKAKLSDGKEIVSYRDTWTGATLTRKIYEVDLSEEELEEIAWRMESKDLSYRPDSERATALRSIVAKVKGINERKAQCHEISS